MRRGKIYGVGAEKRPEDLTDQERKAAAEMQWEPEPPPEGEFIQMRAEDLPEGKELVILDGKGPNGWDVYHVVEKDPFGVVLQDGETVNVGPNDLIEVMDTGKPVKSKAFDLRAKGAASVKRTGAMRLQSQAVWIAENKSKKLGDIEVEVLAVDENGKTYKIKEKADVAIEALTKQKGFAERLLECLNS
jgi:hypothetical protein